MAVTWGHPTTRMTVTWDHPINRMTVTWVIIQIVRQSHGDHPTNRMTVTWDHPRSQNHQINIFTLQIHLQYTSSKYAKNYLEKLR